MTCFTPVDTNNYFSNVYIREVVRSEIQKAAECFEGDSAYSIAVKNGYVGTEDKWLASLGGTISDIKAVSLEAGSAPSASLGGTPRNRIINLGIPKGEKGKEGVQGIPGPKGLSAYDVAVANGFNGTKTDWLLAIKGVKGDAGPEGPKGEEGKSTYELSVDYGYSGSEREWLSGLINDTELMSNLNEDLLSISEAANGDENTTVVTRTGETYPSAKKAISEGIISLFENGGLPATPFATKALMTASELVDGDYAQVTDDTVNNGLYVKTTGAWVKSEYDPLTQAKDYVDEKIKITLDDPEYLLSISDSDSNLLFAITRQGEVIGDFKVLLENGSALTSVLSLKDNIEGELYEIADPQGNILAQVESDGTWVLPAIRTASLDSTEITGGNVNLGGLTEAEITKEKFIRIPEQKYLRLDLTFKALPTDASDARTPETGTCTISDTSKSIVYARTNVKMKVQGHASAGFKKKNFTIDFYNIDGDKLDLKFGDTIASDSYHLKGFYSDPTHMRDQGGYRCWKELVQKLDYPYSKINNIVYSASPSRPTNAEFTADAKYYPHGFPVEVYLNGIFYGLYTLRLKKSRNNYALNNANTDHIFLDSGTYTALLKEPFDATDWEIKSPKMKGYDDLGLIPSAFTETVGASCARLFEFTRTLSTSYPNHADYIVLPHWILWYLMCELTGDWDHDGNNYNIITWNNEQWSIIPYDLDWTLNWTTGFGNLQSTDLLSSDIWTTFRTVFAPEIKALWTKYRENGDITVEKMVKHYRNIVNNVPRDIYKADKDKWGIYPSFSNDNYPDLEQVYRWFEARIEYLDSKYLII